MTPRQLAAFDQLRHWRQEEELANLAEAVWMAHHADKDAFAKMIKQMRS
ncbi:hypothetical protein ACQZ46_23720 [Agrobacterium salinitolerans]